MILTSDEIRLILNSIGQTVVVPESENFPYRVVSTRDFGYSKDKAIGQLQAKLSIMLEMAETAKR